MTVRSSACLPASSSARSARRGRVGVEAVVVGILAALLATPARGESYLYRLDPESTVIRFVVDATMHKVRGTAALERGEIRFDRSGAARGEVVIDATSAETGNEKRDRDMHVKVLESETFPEIVLEVSGYEGELDLEAPSEVVVDGVLRLHGGDHPLRLEMTLSPRGDRLAAATSFVVPYVDWGMKNPSKAFLRVGKTVEVTIEADGALTAAE